MVFYYAFLVHLHSLRDDCSPSASLEQTSCDKGNVALNPAPRQLTFALQHRLIVVIFFEVHQSTCIVNMAVEAKTGRTSRRRSKQGTIVCCRAAPGVGFAIDDALSSLVLLSGSHA